MLKYLNVKYEMSNVICVTSHGSGTVCCILVISPFAAC
jgi:hypothetical protein